MNINDQLNAEATQSLDDQTSCSGDRRSDEECSGTMSKHFTLRSPSSWSFIPPTLLENENEGRDVYAGFEGKLRQFLTRELALPVTPYSILKVCNSVSNCHFNTDKSK